MSNNEYMHSPMVSLLEKISIPCLADKKTGKFEDTSKLKLIDEEITNANFDTYNSLTPNWYYKVLR